MGQVKPHLAQLIAGRYQLGASLGHGGMSDVYEGHDTRLDRPVAVKLMRSVAVAGAGGRPRFEEEARAAASLSHPNVVTVFDFGEYEGAPFIVMERLPGETLADVIGHRPLDVDGARQVITEVLAALEVAHRQGIVHRDIKPGNILLAADGRAKVADFGIAKSVESVVTATATGVLLGTPAYLAPERVAGRPATVASDLYAVGVVLYEALTGRRPFRGDTPLAVMRAIDAGQREPVDRLRPDLDGRIVAAVERALAKDPRDRFHSAAEMASALETRPAHSSATPAAPESAPTVAMSNPSGSDSATRTQQQPSPTDQAARPSPRIVAFPGRLVRLLIGAVVGAVLVAVALGVGRDSGGQAPTDPVGTPAAADATPVTSGSTGATLPPALDDALDQLDEAVQR